MNYVAIVAFTMFFVYLFLSSKTLYECEFERVVDSDGQPKVFIVDHWMLYHGRDSQVIVNETKDYESRRFAFPREQLKTCKSENEDGH